MLLKFVTRFPPLVLRGAFATAVVTIFILTMIPLPAALTVITFQDKLEHATAFAILLLMGYASWPLQTRMLSAGLFAYGVLIEVCQHTFTVNRVGDPWDVLADTVGVALGLIVVKFLTRS